MYTIIFEEAVTMHCIPRLWYSTVQYIIPSLFIYTCTHTKSIDYYYYYCIHIYIILILYTHSHSLDIYYPLFYTYILY